MYQRLVFGVTACGIALGGLLFLMGKLGLFPLVVWLVVCVAANWLLSSRRTS